LRERLNLMFVCVMLCQVPPAAVWLCGTIEGSLHPTGGDLDRPRMSCTFLLVVACLMEVASTLTVGCHRWPVQHRIVMEAKPPAALGFIGLGIMGNGMARQLRAAGFPLVVWTRNATVAAQLQSEDGATITVVESPQAVVEACERTFLMLPTPEVCHEAYHQDAGVLAGVCEGKQIVDCATLRVEDMEALSEAVRRRGGQFLEAPVSGSKGPAETGQLIFLTAGDRQVFEQAAAEWDAMGKASIFCGEVRLTEGRGVAERKSPEGE
jgi:hypothetical protein